MKVTTLRSTPEPERLVATAARGDYYDGFVGDVAFEDLMEPVDGETIEESKRTLLERLFRRGHWGPFEHPQITLAIEGISRSCMAQLTRHRHASFDVQSMRYVDFGDKDVILPESLKDPEHVARETGEVELDEDMRREFKRRFDKFGEMNIEFYQAMVDHGVPKEDARFMLPIGMPVNLTVSVNARMLLHIEDMRKKADAQWEIREMTEQVHEEFADWMPMTASLYEEHGPHKLAP